MNRIATLLGLGLIFAPLADGPSPLKVTVTVAPRPHFVGQAIEARVAVEPTEDAPAVEPPRVSGAEVFPLPPDPARPSAARYVVVPARGGAIEVPPFRARSGDRSGASRTLRLPIVNVPGDGRPSAFLGGVGPFEVRAEVASASVRLGESVEARVRISGLAAFGSVRPPSLDGWASPTVTVEAQGDRIEVGDVPTRTFVYRVRPLKAGIVRLPPVAIAAFDPTSRRYATRATSSLAIRVEEPPRFDPASLGGPRAPAASQAPRSVTVALEVGGLTVALGSFLAAWTVARRPRAKRPVDPRTLALELSGRLSSDGDEAEAARIVAEALTTYLHRVAGRAPGALTPPEARAGFEGLVEEPGIAVLAETLVARCDRARYGVGTGEAADLIAEGRRFFEAVAGTRDGEGRRGRKPGEAAETASGN